MAMIPGVTAATSAVSGHQSLSTSSWEPEHLGSTKGPTTQGEQPWDMHDLPQTVASSHRSQLVTVGTPQTPQLCVSYSSLSTPTEQVSQP